MFDNKLPSFATTPTKPKQLSPPGSSKHNKLGKRRADDSARFDANECVPFGNPLKKPKGAEPKMDFTQTQDLNPVFAPIPEPNDKHEKYEKSPAKATPATPATPGSSFFGLRPIPPVPFRTPLPGSQTSSSNLTPFTPAATFRPASPHPPSAIVPLSLSNRACDPSQPVIWSPMGRGAVPATPSHTPPSSICGVPALQPFHAEPTPQAAVPALPRAGPVGYEIYDDDDGMMSVASLDWPTPRRDTPVASERVDKLVAEQQEVFARLAAVEARAEAAEEELKEQAKLRERVTAVLEPLEACNQIAKQAADDVAGLEETVSEIIARVEGRILKLKDQASEQLEMSDVEGWRQRLEEMDEKLEDEKEIRICADGATSQHLCKIDSRLQKCQRDIEKLKRKADRAGNRIARHGNDITNVKERLREVMDELV
ncbi:hypothetical protein F4818DRAFT_452399 [Hypoxylon cercidicola]|nr:hypothetical protein F4818DRAFT_452399 [Hypoxylon cercidicola]